MSQAVARLTVELEGPVAMAIDDGVIAAEQKTADLFFHAHLIRAPFDARSMFDASFNAAAAG